MSHGQGNSFREIPRLSRILTTAKGLEQGKSLSIVMCEHMQAKARNRTENPSNAPSALQPRPSKETKRQAWIRYQNNWKWIFTNAAAPTSKDTYSTGWRSYKKFCASVDIDDLFLDIPSPIFAENSLGASGLVGDSPFGYKTTVLLSYIASMYGDEGLSHITVGTYLSGVRYFFSQAHKNIDCFEEPIIAQTRSSLAYLSAQEHSLSEKKTLPVTCDMIVWARDVYFPSLPQTWYNDAIITGMIIAFCCLFRQSELLISAANHYLRGRDVVFGVATIDSPEQLISPREAHLYPFESVVSVSITAHSGKTDWEGEGHRLYFTVNDTLNGYGFDLVRTMFGYAQRARPKDNDAFLMHSDTNMLKYDRMNAAIKDIASKFKFDPSRFSMHSLRIGGASALAAAGAPTHYIQKMGRWKSLAFLRYIYWAVGGMADALKILSNPVHFTADHLRKINPGVVLT